MSKWIPGWANGYTIQKHCKDRPEGISVEFYLESSKSARIKPISELAKDLAISDVIKQMKEKPLSERLEKPRNKYHREIQPNVFVDVYDVLGAFTGKINSRAKSAVDHAIKKLLAPGLRGVKEERQDLVEARDSLNRAIEILDEWA